MGAFVVDGDLFFGLPAALRIVASSSSSESSYFLSVSTSMEPIDRSRVSLPTLLLANGFGVKF